MKCMDLRNEANKELEKIQEYFLWKKYTPKIKHETTCKDYKTGGLKMLIYHTKSKVYSVLG